MPTSSSKRGLPESLDEPGDAINWLMRGTKDIFWMVLGGCFLFCCLLAIGWPMYSSLVSKSSHAFGS